MPNKRLSASPRRRRSSVPLAKEPKLDIDFINIVENRNGAVLTKGTILKAEHFAETRPLGMRESSDEQLLMGAPNWRGSLLRICGTAQPTIVGLATILRVLGCGPEGNQSCVWISAREEPIVYLNQRPFVLREYCNPVENIRIYSGINGERLEQVEERMKQDIIDEVRQHNGLLLVHNEFPNKIIVPCLLSADDIKTSKEIFEECSNDLGFRIKYHRVPVTRMQTPTEAYIDEYVRIFKDTSINNPVVFSCGIGVGRTTFGMVIGMLIRRAQIRSTQGIDAFEAFTKPKNELDQDSRTILRLVYALEQDGTAVEWAMDRSQLVESLRMAIQGNYHVITELIRVMPEGLSHKMVADQAIDFCDHLINIRENILINRVRHFATGSADSLEMALGMLERYFCLIAFAAYIQECFSPDRKDTTFKKWIQDRSEVWYLFTSLRARRGQFKPFRPVDDLSNLNIPNSLELNYSTEGMKSPAAPSLVLKNRAGSVLTSHTILKLDYWASEFTLPVIIPGAPNFRRIDAQRTFAVAQPTVDALIPIIEHISKENKDTPIVWLNVREEPLVYINGDPYVLRDQYATVRNIKAYSGISSDRLEMMESRLKDDIMHELKIYENKLLLHQESNSVLQMRWETVTNVMTPKEVFGQLSNFVEYHRLPVTAEDAWEPQDFDRLLQICNGRDACYIFNCQIGAGRSTMGAVIAAQIFLWKSGGMKEKMIPKHSTVCNFLSYRIIHSLMRLIRSGLECKQIVDEFVDMACEVIHLREVIREYREIAIDVASDPKQVYTAIRKGIFALKRYVMLILFQAYLNEITCSEIICPRPGTPLHEDLSISKSTMSSELPFESFVEWLDRHLEIKLLLSQIDREHGLETIKPAESAIHPDQGIALANEIWQVVENRGGSVLAPMTILKDDHFPGCQKENLSERIEGAPNIRRVKVAENGQCIYGVAMPTEAAIPLVASMIGKKFVWVCLREEPVVFIKGHPYVLRIVKDPVSNLEQTGIISERVELMEERLKSDCLNEATKYKGKLLVHGEELYQGRYVVVPTWEIVDSEQVKTPQQVFTTSSPSLKYYRIPITDEQAPIPVVFDQLLKVIQQNQNLDFCFNCQMGRGRTTTCMVVALLYLTTHDEYTNMTIKSENTFLAGNYKLILNLIGLLPHGRNAKAHVDSCIDKCAHIQNLRECILDYSKKEPERGLNYLVRYFYLIAFAEYLIEERQETFTTWLDDRREVTNLVAKKERIEFL